MSDLAERVQRVRLLLETLNDPYPAPRGALEPDSGPAASRYVPCETCRRSGEVRVRAGWTLCLICDGEGWRRHQRGEPAWDAYMSLPLDEAVSLPRETSARRPIEPRLLEETFTWERVQRAYDRHGSYQKIRAQLLWLGRVQPRRHALVQTVLVEHEPRRLTRVSELELELGVVAITLRVGRVRVPPWLMERSTSGARRETIGGLADAGFGPGEIARKLGVSKRVVQRQLRADARGKIEAALASRPRVLEARRVARQPALTS